MLDFVLRGYRNALNFDGRERRRTFGIFMLIHFVVFFAGLIVLVGGLEKLLPDLIMGTVLAVFVLAWFVPLVSFSVRRLHDANLSGWWMLLGILFLAPFMGMLIVLAPDPSGTDNRYGPSPRTA